MSRSPALAAVAYSVETAFGENISTFGTRMSVLDSVVLSGFKQTKLRPARAAPYRNQIFPNINGTKRGEFKTKFYLPGHGSTCAGAVTLTDRETLLGIVFGRGAADVAAACATAGTTAAAGGTATSLNVALASGYTAGTIVRAGLLGDGRGNGQPLVITTHGTSVIGLQTALAAALTAGDVVYNPVNVNVTENPALNTITSTRWLLQTANQQIEAHGCYPKAVAIEAGTSKLPTIEITWGCAWWDFANISFPPSAGMQVFTPAPTAGGSFFFQLAGTTTRQLLSVRDFKLTYNMVVVELMGPGGTKAVQDIVGCYRGRDTCDVEFTLDAEAASLTPTLAGYWDGNGVYQLLYGLSATDGSAVSLYLPNLVPDGDRPTQQDMDGLNRVTLKLNAGTSGVTTSEVALSMFRLAMG